MSVDSFDPASLSAALDPKLVERLLTYAPDSEARLDLPAEQVALFAPLVIHADWPEVAEQCSDEQLHLLARIFTVGEMQYPSWSAGDKSAVIAIVRVLKARGAFTTEDKRWIKSHTDNRFLPHGNLMHRL